MSSHINVVDPTNKDYRTITKVILNKIGAGYRSSNALNNDFDLIEEGFEQTLSRTQDSDNQMEVPLDMNSNPILNLPDPVRDTDAVRLGDVQDLVSQAIEAQDFQFFAEPLETIRDKVKISPETTSLRTSGYSKPGDLGDALYKRVSSEPDHAGKFQSADGAWWELSEAVATPQMFGAKGDGVTDDWRAIQDAFQWSRGKKILFPLGQYMSSKTLVGSKSMSAAGVSPPDQWNSGVSSGVADLSSGASIVFYGPGNPALWTDIDGGDAPDFRPGLVLQTGSTLKNLTVLNIDGSTWDAGVFLAGATRVFIDRVNTVGAWDKGGLYIDATWGIGTTGLRDAHPEIENPGGCFEIAVSNCWLRGRGGLTVQGTTRNPDDFTSAEWVWNPAGTSDLTFSNCRFESDRWYVSEAARKVRGWAYKHDAATKSNPSLVGQGHFFNSCYFRTASLHSILLDRSNRDTFVNCYGETNVSSFSPRSRIEVTSRTGSWSMVNDAIVAPLWKDGVELVNDLSVLLPEHCQAAGLFYQRYTGRLVSPNILLAGNVNTTANRFVSRQASGEHHFGSMVGTTYTPKWFLSNNTFRPFQDNPDPFLGLSNSPWGIAYIKDIRPGGSSGPRIVFNPTNPEGVVSAPRGSLCLTDEGPFFKTTSSGNTGWQSVTLSGSDGT